jgi:hypothetical protein
MTGEIDEIENNDYLVDEDGYDICPFTKTRCYSPWLRGDCWNDCPRAHYDSRGDW